MAKDRLFYHRTSNSIILTHFSLSFVTFNFSFTDQYIPLETMTYSHRGRSLIELIFAISLTSFLVGFVSVLCIGNYLRARRSQERQRARREENKKNGGSASKFKRNQFSSTSHSNNTNNSSFNPQLTNNLTLTNSNTYSDYSGVRHPKSISANSSSDVTTDLLNLGLTDTSNNSNDSYNRRRGNQLIDV